MKVCIIGAGSSGITAAQVLAERGVDFDCFELGSGVGGNWRYGNDNGVSSAYRSLHINTSRDAMQYAAYPMSTELPDYPSHWQIAAYFDEFVDHFGLRQRITFRTEVTSVAPQGTGYDVTTRTRDDHQIRTRHYDHVIVANGHHWNPRWPEPAFPGEFSGEQLHAHHYRTPEVLAGKRVVVLGIGNSATDIAVEASRVASATYLSTRRGAHILPKFLFGMPTDHLTDSPLARGPLFLQSWGMRAMLRLSVGKVTDYGLPKPDHAVLHAHPTVSSDLLTRLGHGDLGVKPAISGFDGSTVRFTDGSEVEADVVVFCTGYRITFPFLDDRLLPGGGLSAGEDNHVDLYRRVVSVDHPGLFFIGLIQSIGAVMPLAEQQAHWVADLITGVCRLPSRERMRAQIARYDERLRRRYVASVRHTIQVDAHAYTAELRKERKHSRR